MHSNNRKSVGTTVTTGRQCTHHALRSAQWHTDQLEERKQRQSQCRAPSTTDMIKHQSHPMLRKPAALQTFMLAWRHLKSAVSIRMPLYLPHHAILSKACSLSPDPVISSSNSWVSDERLQQFFFLPPHIPQRSTKVICWVFITSFSGFVPEVSSCCRGFDTVLSKTDSNGIGILTTEIVNFSSLARGRSFNRTAATQAAKRWSNLVVRFCIMCWFSQRYLVAAEQHLSPEQLFFHSTTTYWVTQSAQPSLAIPLGVPGAHAKSLQLSLPYLLLMSALRYTNPCHYQSRLPHTFKPELFFVFSATPRFFCFVLFFCIQCFIGSMQTEEGDMAAFGFCRQAAQIGLHSP